MIIGRICTFYELFPQFCSHITEKMCNFALSMKHRRLDKYVTLYTVCREGGKVIYSYVETLPQMNDEMSSYNHYKPEEICTCGRWIFFEHMPFYDEKQLVEIVYRKTTKKSTEGQPEKIKEKMSSVRVPAFQKESVKHFFDWLKETKASGASVLQALREAKYAMESKAEKYAESPTLQSMAEDMKKQIALLEELEDKLPRL